VCLFSLQPGGFTIEISNNNSTMVMTGMRIQIGTQAIERAPSYIEIFGRTMQLNLSRSRWFDFPFTREEALQADKKLNLFSESLTSDANSVLIRPWNCLLPAYDSPVFRTLSLPPPLSSPVVSAIGKLSFI
jgi:E3 ubiquitin-protein ligase UBR4